MTDLPADEKFVKDLAYASSRAMQGHWDRANTHQNESAPVEMRFDSDKNAFIFDCGKNQEGVRSGLITDVQGGLARMGFTEHDYRINEGKNPDDPSILETRFRFNIGTWNTLDTEGSIQANQIVRPWEKLIFSNINGLVSPPIFLINCLKMLS